MLSEATSGLKVAAGTHALFGRHRRRASGRDVHHNVGALLDHFQEGSEGLGRLIGSSVLRIAGVQVHDRSPCLRCSDGVIGDLLSGHRQMR